MDYYHFYFFPLLYSLNFRVSLETPVAKGTRAGKDRAARCILEILCKYIYFFSLCLLNREVFVAVGFNTT